MAEFNPFDVDVMSATPDVAATRDVAATPDVAATRDVRLTPNGKFYVTASVDNKIHVWDLTTGLEIASLTPTSEIMNAIALDDTRVVISLVNQTAIIWNFVTGLKKSLYAGSLFGGSPGDRSPSP